MNIAEAELSGSTLVLMDEPLSNLDAKLRGHMRTEIRRLERQLEMTVIYVTHDQVEAMTMGDRIMVLHDGKVQQTGTPLELYNAPANTFVAGFIGSPQMNIAEAELSGSTLVLNHSLAVPLTESERRSLPEGSRWKIGVRPEQIELAAPGSAAACTATLCSTEMMGNETQVLFSVGAHTFTARWPGQYLLEGGRAIRVLLSPDTFHFFDEETGVLLRSTLTIKGSDRQSA